MNDFLWKVWFYITLPFTTLFFLLFVVPAVLSIQVAWKVAPNKMGAWNLKRHIYQNSEWERKIAKGRRTE